MTSQGGRLRKVIRGTSIAAALLMAIDVASATEADISRSSATGGCMLAIKKVLHDPASASFGHSDEASVSIKGSRAMVIRSARATNGFGAKRNTDFICFLEQRSDEIYVHLVAEKGQNTARVQAMMKKWKMP